MTHFSEMTVFELADWVEANHIEMTHVALQHLAVCVVSESLSITDLLDFEILAPLLARVSSLDENLCEALFVFLNNSANKQSVQEIYLQTRICDLIVDHFCMWMSRHNTVYANFPLVLCLVKGNNVCKSKFIQRSGLLVDMLKMCLYTRDDELWEIFSTLLRDDDVVARNNPATIFARDTLNGMENLVCEVAAIKFANNPSNAFYVLIAVSWNPELMRRIALDFGWLVRAMNIVSNGVACQFIRHISFSEELKSDLWDIFSKMENSVNEWIIGAGRDMSVCGHLFGTMTNLGMRNNSRSEKICCQFPKLILLAEHLLLSDKTISSFVQIQILQFLRLVSQFNFNLIIQFTEVLTQNKQFSKNSTIERISQEILHKADDS